MLTASINVTCDGFCNHEDVVADDEFSDVGASLVERADRVLLGRTTYEIFADYWPAAARDANRPASEYRLARAIVDTPRTVVSRTLTRSDWDGTSFIGDLADRELRELCQREDVLLLGSPSIQSQLAERGMIDRFVFLVHPLLAGRGTRLHSSEAADKLPSPKFVSSRTLGSGVQVIELESERKL